MRHFKKYSFEAPYPTQVQIGEFDPDEHKESEDTIYCPVWEWQEDPETNEIIPGSQVHDYVSVGYNFETGTLETAEEITEDEFDKLYQDYLDNYPCNTDCARYRQGDCPFNPITKAIDCPRFKS